MPRKIRYRWGIRSLLLIVTVAALILAVRTNERSNIRSVIHQVKSNGGYVLYHWETPAIDDQDFTITLPIRMPILGQDGQATTNQLSSQTVNVVVTDFSFQSDDRPVTNLINFLGGTHTDIDIHTVVVEADTIDDNLANALARLKRLQSVRWVSNVQVLSAEERMANVLQLKMHLPNVEVKYAANYDLDDR